MKLQAVGYMALVEKFSLDVIPNWHSSCIAINSHTHRIEKEGDFIK